MARIVISIVWLWILFADAIAGGRSFQKNHLAELFNQGCSLYQGGDFDGARRCFEKIVESGIRSPTVYFNLGNAYFKVGEIGKAVACYRRAQMLSPRDKDVKANLEIARSGISLEGQLSGYKASSASVALLLAPAENIRVCHVLAYLVASIIVGAILVDRSKRRILLRMMLGLIICLIFFGSLYFYQTSQIRHNRDGVVISSTPIMAGPGTAFEEVGRLSQGIEVKILSESGIWVEVKLAGGIIGWVPKESIERLWEGFLL